MECCTNNCDVQNNLEIVQGCIKNSPVYYDLHRLMAAETFLFIIFNHILFTFLAG